MLYFKRYPDFTTVTCWRWLPILEDGCNKDIIINSMRFLTRENRAIIYAFVIMETHFHLIWQLIGDHELKNVQRDFLKYTSQRILGNLDMGNSPLLEDLTVNKRDRKRQVWMRNSLSVLLWSQAVFDTETWSYS